MDNEYVAEMITRQRVDEAARQARTAHHRRQIKTRTPAGTSPRSPFPVAGPVATLRPA